MQGAPKSIGRGLRVADDKEELTLFDLSDDLVYNGVSELHYEAYVREGKHL